MKPLQINKIKNQQGFSLIEILVALFLVSLVMGLAITNPFSTENQLENEIKGIERAIRFMSDESALRNTITRLHLFMSKDPQEYAVEYGPSSQFVLPARSESDTKVLSKEEEEKEKKDIKELNNKFARISEFQDSNKEFDQNVKVLAVGFSNNRNLQKSGEISIYTYPTGEKDEVFIILVQDQTVATISTEAFSSKILHNYYHLDNSNEKELQEAYDKKAKELFDEWLKGRK